MWRQVQRWLESVPIADPIQRRQSPIVQMMLSGLIVLFVAGLPLAFTGFSGTPLVTALSSSAMAIVIAGSTVALFLTRRGHFIAGVQIAVLALLAGLSIFAWLNGINASGLIPLAFVMPITLAGLLLPRSGLFLSAGLAFLALGVTLVLEQLPTPLAGLYPSGSDDGAGISFTSALPFAMIIAVLCLFFDRFGAVLREAIANARAREHELEALRDSLEETVVARTADLQQTIAALQSSQATVRELSAPVLPVLDGVLVAPLIGAFDSARTAALTDVILAAVAGHRARLVIFDITGVTVVDTAVAQALLSTAGAVRLLGAEPILVGIRAEIAQTIVALNLDLQRLRTYANLRAAISALQYHS